MDFLDPILNPILNFSLGDQTIGDILTLDFLLSIAGNVLSAIFILLVGYTIAGWVKRRIRSIGTARPDMDTTLFNFLGNLARYAILAFTFLFVLNTFGVQTTSIVAAIGAAGLAIGLALQGTLTNIAAGVMIIFFRPIKEGDFVEVNGQMGTVKEVTLNFTELASIGNVQIIIPNKDVWGNTIVNYSVYPHRRAEWTFGVGYGVNLADAERVIRETVLGDKRTMTDEDLWLQVNNLNDSSVDFMCRAWVDADDYFAYQADIKRKVKEALDAEGLDIPFPTRTIVHHIPESGGDETERSDDPETSEDSAKADEELT
ncbi:Small-conductance mechanosensitive channel [Rhodobacteraceae bacterium THAF1]|uniref:mechanosensitive ion channel family protein n=1 Tax=Palleronia sp. THAF1 TaxID=2587842 RepID=UPI000F40EF2C|nr:mechanosensitive ion channel domain-containing protein [Palleronia sp. THAF1]QFU10039.1 Small-conductance mechanosensitive channel [Palleronia sp. THAF1]VDC17056.1 Small-conductance mechanosensitive channel [Rhodobacteraceae bacterium THAF1]